MLSVEREAYIADKLKQHGKVMVNELADELDVASMTIRRDLRRLEEQGVLERVHGGAVLTGTPLRERPFTEKQLIQTRTKELIAREALGLLSEGETILLDAGTTTFALASLLKATHGIHVVTSDLHIAMELCSAEGKLFFIGGEIEKDLARARGAKALQFLSDIHVDTVFLGISAISDDFILGSHTIDNAELKRAMLKCGSKKVLLADRDKFGMRTFARVGPLHMMDVLITDREFTEREMSYLDTHGVALRQVG